MSQRVYNDLKAIIKDVMKRADLTDYFLGKVINTDPIEIEIDPNYPPYPQELLVIPQYLTKHTVTVLMPGEDGGEPVPQEYVVDNSIQLWDIVIILKVQHGEKYIVLDRLGVYGNEQIT